MNRQKGLTDVLKNGILRVRMLDDTESGIDEAPFLEEPDE